ncbi:uncharacterized protein LOC125596114 [Brassica napus]|uniref:uncharacterized protein LOC125596114 n=1 Tax=Brassica napus TaxID=3708 RepID=UPI002078B950|nr:uncharacterized protein LOC125596114 [Brassica napus]
MSLVSWNNIGLDQNGFMDYPIQPNVTFVVREKELRRCSPFLERSSIPGDDAATDLRSNEWKAVPDIWRSSADKYGDKVVVLDPFRMVSFHLFLKCWNVSTMCCCGFQNPDLQSYDFIFQICKTCGRIACGWGLHE